MKRIDACFGEFLVALKELHLYDNSIVVLTADHGDSLGEGQRWGHGFTVFPGDADSARHPCTWRCGRASLPIWRASAFDRYHTDVMRARREMPSLPRERDERRVSASGAAVGRPVPAPSGRVHVASSYGAVYGLLSHNGRRLYIADGIEGREYAFDLSPGAGDRRIGVTDAERDAARLTIRRQIGELADWYHFTPAP